jgi:hypothetical protein
MAKSFTILKGSHHVWGMICIWSEAFWRVVHKRQAIQFSSLTLALVWCQRTDWGQWLQVSESSVVCFWGSGMILYDRNERTECIMFKAQWHLLFWQNKCPDSQHISSLFPVWFVQMWPFGSDRMMLFPAITFCMTLGNSFISLSLNLCLLTLF